MNVSELQAELKAAGFYSGKVDGSYGPMSRGALQAALKGDLTPLSQAALEIAAVALNTTWEHIGAVYAVESAGRGFHPDTGLPLILFEPHIFCRLTAGAFSASHPDVSYPRQGQKPYPPGQAARWAQMHEAIALAPDAALESASWGLFQVMGFQYRPAGFTSVWEFCRGISRSEAAQLLSFGDFLVDQKIDRFMRDGDWTRFAEAYNGPGYARNHYDQRLKAAFARLVGQ